MIPKNDTDSLFYDSSAAQAYALDILRKPPASVRVEAVLVLLLLVLFFFPLLLLAAVGAACLHSL